MWFDPAREVPLLGHLPPDGEEADGFYEGGALQVGTSEGEEGVPCEGDAAKMSEEDQSELPF